MKISGHSQIVQTVQEVCLKLFFATHASTVPMNKYDVVGHKSREAACIICSRAAFQSFHTAAILETSESVSEFGELSKFASLVNGTHWFAIKQEPEPSSLVRRISQGN